MEFLTVKQLLREAKLAMVKFSHIFLNKDIITDEGSEGG